MKRIDVMICSTIGRDLVEPTNRKRKEKTVWVQQLEIGSADFSNSLTHVAKDNYVIEFYQ